ncbi:hypothetical protein HDU67_001775 [Dinochytrium kinnereticum]|nr:hypothetical protein HDU67_001775 [Dinochytrium kinnereticum]
MSSFLLASTAGEEYAEEDLLQQRNDEVLQNHYTKVQQKLLESVDRQVAEIETQLNEKDRILQRVEDEKTNLGVGLYKARAEIGKLNTNLYETRDYLDKTESELRFVAADRDAAEKEIRSFASLNKQLPLTDVKNLATELEDSRRKLEDSNIKISKLGEINSAYTSGLKIHRRIESKLKKEMELATEKRRLAEQDLEKERKRAEQLQGLKQELELVLEAQKHETATATQTIAKLNREINELAASKKRTEKQWEDAITAMSKRDITMQEVDQSRENIKEEFLESQNIIRVLKIEKGEADKKLKEKELECEGLQSQVQFLRSSLSSIDSKQRETRASLVEAQVAESLYKEELNKVTKHHTLAKDELDRKSQRISDLKANIDKMKDEFDLKIRNELIVQVAKKEEIVQTQAEIEIKKIQRNEEGKNIDLRSENAQFRMRIHDLDEKLRVSNLEKQSYERCFTEVNTHYVRLYEEAKHLMYDLERKEHDVNYLKATIQEYNEETRKKHTQLGITETIRGKTVEEVEASRKETFEQKMEASKLYAELRKLQPLVEEYRQKMINLEQQLTECRLQLEEEHVNSLNATNMLKTELRRLYTDRKEVRRARMLDEKTNEGLERKYMLAKEMVEKLKAERHELQRTAFELKVKAGEMEKKYFDAQIMAKKMAEQAGRTVGEITTRLASNTKGSGQSDDFFDFNLPPSNGLAALVPIKLPPPVWASLGSTPGGSQSLAPPGGSKEDMQPKGASLASEKASSKSVVSEASQELPDFHSWKLKIESLTCERAFLVNENCLLKSKVEDLTIKIAKTERMNSQAQQRLKNIDRDLKNLQTQNKAISSKYQRAEKVAASIERQFKEARPNTRIDYSLMMEAEPSTQLLAALMQKDSDGYEPPQPLPSLSEKKEIPSFAGFSRRSTMVK